MRAKSRMRVFFDTNILVYQFDRSAPSKQKRATSLIAQALQDGSGIISSQVIQEFLNVALNKFETRPTNTELEQILDDLLRPLCDHRPTVDFYRQALKLYLSESISFYDALIVQAAIDSHCSTLYSEDLQHGRHYGLLRVCNPFV